MRGDAAHCWEASDRQTCIFVRGSPGDGSSSRGTCLARIIHEGSSRNRGDAMRDGRVER